jgi:hypothetical protein
MTSEPLATPLARAWKGDEIRLRRVVVDVTEELVWRQPDHVLRRRRVVNGPPADEVELGDEEKREVVTELEDQVKQDPSSPDATIVSAFAAQARMSMRP